METFSRKQTFLNVKEQRGNALEKISRGYWSSDPFLPFSSSASLTKVDVETCQSQIDEYVTMVCHGLKI